MDLALRVSAQTGDSALVRRMLAERASVNDPDSRGLSPLWYASNRGHKDVVQMLLRAGASTGVQNSDGHSPLHRSAFGGHLEVVLLLLAAGGQLNEKDNQGMTPLHLAAVHGHQRVVETLLESGADPTVQNESGATALETAEKRGHLRAAEVIRGAVEAWSRPFLLQLTAGAQLDQFIFRTLAGNVAATLSWNFEEPAMALPNAILSAMHGSSFEPPFEVRTGNLRVVTSTGTMLDMTPSAAPLADQLGQLAT